LKSNKIVNLIQGKLPVNVMTQIEFRVYKGLLAIILAVTLTACKSKVSGSTEKERQHIDLWGKDSVGCLRLRTIELAKEMIAENHLMNSSKNDFIKVFNSPNVILQTQGGEVLKYYFDGFCENGIPIGDSDKCYATFLFKDGELFNTNFTCE
jgi:hypothetical protein